LSVTSVMVNLIWVYATSGPLMNNTPSQGMVKLGIGWGSNTWVNYDLLLRFKPKGYMCRCLSWWCMWDQTRFYSLSQIS